MQLLIDMYDRLCLPRRISDGGMNDATKIVAHIVNLLCCRHVLAMHCDNDCYYGLSRSTSHIYKRGDAVWQARTWTDKAREHISY